MNRAVISALLGVLLLAGTAPAAPEGKRGGRGKGHKEQPTQNSTCLDVPEHPLDIILGRPTRDSVTLSVLAYQDTEGCIAYGTERGNLPLQTPRQQLKKGEPAEILIGSLQPGTRYFYEFRARGMDPVGGAFHTRRPPGDTFTFTITADSHLDSNVSAECYQRTLANALADAPDFHVDLGDTFMSEKHDSRDTAARQYLAQRFYFGLLCRAAPLFLVLGNHDGESPRGQGGGGDELAVWSNTMRKRYFPNPEPDGFYTGDGKKHPGAGLLQDYYAWEWGDAQFIVLDPFWFTQKERGQRDNWKRTLGGEQYRWLDQTLQDSRSRFKFVFIHHLVGGLDEQCRGGSEAAPFYEWGGKNADGTDGFKEHRKGWPAPIHQLLVRNGVNIVFHGHDHLYAKQDLDGIVYQEVPQPGNSGNARTPRHAEEYGYRNGVILGGSGHMRVTVSPDKVAADYIAAVPSEKKAAHSYTLPAR
jgi:predicted phosphodiesterase